MEPAPVLSIDPLDIVDHNVNDDTIDPSQLLDNPTIMNDNHTNHQQQQPPPPNHTNNDTIVNGQGIFKSWTRNFPNPSDAILDLLDNAVDACREQGHIVLKADHRWTGLCLFNSSSVEIRPLSQVFQLYTSNKHATGAIGENGVGLKQGAATLSDLTIIITRNMDTFSIGIISLHLQTSTDCWLPSFTLQSHTRSDLRDELKTLFGQDVRLRACIASYGDDFDDAIERLMHTMNAMCRKEWRDHKYVFGLLLHELKHGGDTNEPWNKVEHFLKTIEKELPSRYLHVPEGIHIHVGKNKIDFNYWQPRLVELTVFNIRVNKDVALRMDPWWHCPDNSVDPSGYYLLQVYMGFDALRVMDEKQASTCTLHIYSRACGRLIRTTVDARGELGLSNGGTDYCQGLTMIVDDGLSQLPLNPTKHDVAFTEHANGAIHRDNLYCFLNAIGRFYYKYYKEGVFNNKKTALTAALKEKGKEVVNLVMDHEQKFVRIDHCKLNSFYEYRQNTNAVRNNRLRVFSPWHAHMDLKVGEDTYLRFPQKLAPPVAPDPANYPRKRQNRSGADMNGIPAAATNGYTTLQNGAADGAREQELLRHIQKLQADHRTVTAELVNVRTERNNLRVAFNNMQMDRDRLRAERDDVKARLYQIQNALR